jgi:hypothetical protein
LLLDQLDLVARVTAIVTTLSPSSIEAMSDSKNGTGRGSVRDISSVRPRRGRVKLVRIDPSETNGEMEEMKLIYSNPHLDVRVLKKSLQAAA